MGNMFARPRPNANNQPTFTAVTNLPSEPPTAATAIATGVPIAPAVVAATVANAPASLAAAAEPIQLTASAEKHSLSHGSEHEVLAMLSLKAPPAVENSDQRPAMDIVCCIDRSGSMRGQKMTLMIETLNLLLTRGGLGSNDRVALVTFDSAVKLELPLEHMTKQGREKAEAIVKGLRPGATTNLSGGALKAIDVLDSACAPSPDGQVKGGETKEERRTRACLVFTDGQANEGIRDPSKLVAAVSNALAAAAAKGGPISLFTFGFGDDHNETCLRALATSTSGGGLYYFLEKAEDIPNAFADVLGGLSSVVAQNAALTLAPVGEGVTISRLAGNTYRVNGDGVGGGGGGTLELGDLYAEDEKDILLYLKLPKLPAAAGEAPVLVASLRAFNVGRSAPELVEATLTVARPAVTPASQPTNLHLDEQRNRIEAAEAMEQAMKMADAGNVEGGRASLEACRRLISQTPSAAAGQTLSLNLMQEMEELQTTYESAGVYRSVGSKMSAMKASSHQRQRAVHSNSEMYAGAAKRKKAMKMAWFSSMPGAGSDSD